MVGHLYWFGTRPNYELEARCEAIAGFIHERRPSSVCELERDDSCSSRDCLAIPVALKKGQPGTPEFRLALRDAIEGLKEFVGAQGVFNLSATDHNGVDDRSQVMVRVEAGGWKLVK